MDINNILAQLRDERDLIDEAIVSLTRLAVARGRKRGRPPAWMSPITTKRRGRPPGSKNKPRSAAPSRREMAVSSATTDG